MFKEFLPFNTVRNDAIKLAHKICQDGFIPDVLYCPLRGGAYMANMISEYFKLVCKDRKPVLFAAVVARSYTDVRKHSAVHIDGWTYSPDHLRSGDKILLVDDIYDSGRTLNFLVETLIEKGVPREDIKVVVHDYKHFTYREELPVVPDYWCRKFEITKPEEDRWIHYMSHELVGLSQDDLEKYYYTDDPALRDVLGPLFS